ncbi:uncharacterized protein N7458_005374 [Penicillium daleae]|uniref:Nephrocystin 3-like N-terminal domain-containing protein n=1 Tax=Penicillium daleae TaxID=63821 RepID=A0AAD6G3T0_9EURO|nr:uncharacterized protein N7458_005374 [Penicillium daleae]KAJ5454418.1 hypothetical protein N7458_005374 [Penicillium daleae]
MNDHRYDSPQLVDTVKKYKQGLSDTEYRRCLDNLQSLDPCHDKNRIEDDKDSLLRDLYCWVLDDPQFKKWIDGDFGQLLWIKGEPSKGKTMLLCGIIDELHKIITRDTNISFFFCQATNSRINNATAVLRGLIYMLVKKQRSLIKHIQDGNFDGENA